MSLTQDDIPELYNDMHAVHLACRLLCLRCLAHRLIEFGFERSVNDREPRDLLALSILLNRTFGPVLIREAYARGDDQLKSWIATKLPADFPQEVPLE